MQRYVFQTFFVDFEIDGYMVRYIPEYSPLASANITQQCVTKLEWTLKGGLWVPMASYYCGSHPISDHAVSLPIQHW